MPGFILILSLGLVFNQSFQFGYADRPLLSDYSNEFSRFYFVSGISKFTEDEGYTSCANPDTQIYEANIHKDSLINLDGVKSDTLFVILSESNSDSFRYLQIVPPSLPGFPSYLVNLEKPQNHPTTGGMYRPD